MTTGFRATDGATYADCLCGQKKNFAEVSLSKDQYVEGFKTLNIQTLSVGGEEAEVSEFPWAALLQLRSSETNKTSRCGGSLISDRHVLTAGHCLRETAKNGEIEDVYDDITVVLGKHSKYSKHSR